MASLAGMLRARGWVVTGSDENVYPPMSEMLASLGVEIRTPYRAENIPPAVDLVIVGNAISRGNPELEEVLDRGLPCVSMPEVVKELFLRGKTSLVVAGTHGKTTTASLLAWVLESAGQAPGFLVGGVPLNFGASYRLTGGELFVIEGDEYDTAYFDKGPKFLHYLPAVVVLGNIEYDHADIYPNIESVEIAFRRLVNLIPRRGLLLVGSESPLAARVAEGASSRVESFALGCEALWWVRLVEVSEEGSRFDIMHGSEFFAAVKAPFWGDAALRNVLAVSAAAHHCGVEPEALAAGLATFRGVKRRLEVKGERAGVTVIDDFAHHPTAVRETLRAARRRWSGRRLWAVFEPRSFTARSNVFQEELPGALAEADHVVLAPVFSSRRLPAERELSEEQVVEDLRGRSVEAWFLPTVNAIVDHLRSRLREGDVVLAMSNGGFEGLPLRLLETLG